MSGRNVQGSWGRNDDIIAIDRDQSALAQPRVASKSLFVPFSSSQMSVSSIDLQGIDVLSDSLSFFGDDYASMYDDGIVKVCLTG